MLTVFIWSVVSQDCWLRRVNSEAHSVSELGGHARGAFSAWSDAIGRSLP